MEMKELKVSVILPVYNSEKYLRQCLDSLCSQSLKDIEIICVDDGSEDSSLEILKEYERRNSQIRIFAQENQGAGAARNLGLKKARGESLSFLDADDFFEPNMLQSAYEKMEQCHADFVVFESDQFYMNTGKYVKNPWVVKRGDIPPYMPFSHRELTDNIFQTFVGWAWDKLYRRSFIVENKLFFQEQRTTNDLLFVFSALVLAKRIAVVYETLAHQRRDLETSLSVTRERSWHCFFDALIALREQLIKSGKFWETERDFVNYSLKFSLWNLKTLNEPTKSMLRYRLKSEWFNVLGINEKPKEYFYDANDYATYQKIMKI